MGLHLMLALGAVVIEIYCLGESTTTRATSKLQQHSLIRAKATPGTVDNFPPHFLVAVAWGQKRNHDSRARPTLESQLTQPRLVIRVQNQGRNCDLTKTEGDINIDFI